MSHPQALNEEQILQLMTNAIPAIARRLEQDEGWAFLMKQANRVKDLEAKNARLKADNDNLRKALEVVEEDRMRLKAEVERLTKQKAVYIDNDKVLAEMERLKAEVKEKTALIAKLHKDAETSDRESMSDEYDLNHKTKVINGLLRDKEKLQAEVERLTNTSTNANRFLISGLEQDVAILKAEVERLTANTTKLCTHGDAEIARLKAEVERLTKAGDAMMVIMYEDDGTTQDAYARCHRLWNAAKKGNQP